MKIIVRLNWMLHYGTAPRWKTGVKIIQVGKPLIINKINKIMKIIPNPHDTSPRRQYHVRLPLVTASCLFYNLIPIIVNTTLDSTKGDTETLS